MKVRKLVFGKDYPDICEWWRARKWKAPSKTRLPNLGFVAEEDGIKYAAVWVYLSNSGMAWMEWMVTNPTSPLRGRKPAIESLLDFLKLECPQVGIEALMTSTASKSLIKLYQEKGFVATETGMTNLVMRV